MPAISVFDIFKIGVGPSSSHTVGPMKAARQFALGLANTRHQVARIQVTLHGSLAYTGKGHGTDSAVILGLMGCRPDTLDPDDVDGMLRAVHASARITVPGIGEIEFSPNDDLVFEYGEELPRHTNGMRFAALDADGNILLSDDYYSLGGGFVARGDEPELSNQEGEPPFPFSSGDELLELAEKNSLTIAELILRNEQQWRSAEEITERLMNIWSAMQSCVARGLRTEGVLPGPLAVTRRAPKLLRKIQQRSTRDGLDIMDWVNIFAIAVNEENAAGGRVVTSPTNGAAGIIPAVLHYYEKFVADASDEGIRQLLLVAGAIGTLYKINASISGAEMGCQGEVGVACSMAAAGLVAALGGSNSQVENAAEIGMEHNLGLTCDPVGGLVQIPCIERNAMGAVKAINAARLAMQGDGSHKVTLDQVISTMRQTGLDMATIYKETSEGGLAVNVPEC
ncbi:L-serine deaminase II [uncultured Woeseiaceae bacterium]|uniref:L-serine dehydratase n=1 Tax=uncultured Woeseiaceae bacterium TaxID=1983305 RepID=A0A7D9D2K3_9GAMM|nr:L-serine deaminase II [uncultured Woeseiaceae bacterium]